MPNPVPKLSLELVPQSAWGFNLRSELRPSEWDRLRKATYAKAGHKCEVCGGVGPKGRLEAHERWSYDDASHVQTLVSLEALCTRCHECRHLGRAMAVGNGDRALAHLDRVNGWTPKQTEDHVVGAMAVWRERSRHSWTLDLSWLTDVEV